MKGGWHLGGEGGHEPGLCQGEDPWPYLVEESAELLLLSLGRLVLAELFSHCLRAAQLSWIFYYQAAAELLLLLALMHLSR